MIRGHLKHIIHTAAEHHAFKLIAFGRNADKKTPWVTIRKRPSHLNEVEIKQSFKIPSHL